MDELNVINGKSTLYVIDIRMMRVKTTNSFQTRVPPLFSQSIRQMMKVHVNGIRICIFIQTHYCFRFRFAKNNRAILFIKLGLRVKG